MLELTQFLSGRISMLTNRPRHILLIFATNNARFDLHVCVVCVCVGEGKGERRGEGSHVIAY